MTAAGPGPARGGHEGFDELAVGWALHALEPEDEHVFTAHLAGCARCARTVAETTDVMSAMATDLPVAEPSDSLRDRLRAAVEETPQEIRPTPPPAGLPPAARPARPAAGPSGDDVAPFPTSAPHPPASSGSTAAGGDPDTGRPGFLGPRRSGVRGGPAWRRVMPNALVAAAVAAVLALGTWNVLVTGDRDAARATAAAQADVMEALLTPGRATIAPLADDDGHTVATVVARDGQAQVVADAMGTNDAADSTYVLWGMTDTTPVPLGTFDIVDTGMDLRTVGSETTGLDDYSAYAVSLEPGDQAPAYPSDIVARGQVTS